MTVALSVVLVLLLALLFEGGRRALVILQGILGALALIEAALQRDNGELEHVFSARLKLLEQDVQDLPRTWDAIKREAASAETRARYHTRRALQELEDHGFTSAGVEGVAQELGLRDVQGGGDEGVQPLHEGLESRPAPAPVPEEDYLTLGNRRKYA